MESALPVSQILFLEVWVELLQLFFFPGLCRINDNAQEFVISIANLRETSKFFRVAAIGVVANPATENICSLFRLTMKGCLHVRRSAVKILRILPQEAVEMMIIVDFVSITRS